ncbi:hypothetical protein HY311_00945 [Candidatus Nomurabacteria bacterium]|nr:hypothetical protein [Candidatus Nomurabacteria bacterium]
MKLRFLLLYLVITLMGTSVVLPFEAKASSPDTILVNIAPQNPAPGETVTITLNSYVDNLNSVLISWSVNGKSGLSGIGKKSFSLNAPAAGAQTTVIATTKLPDGDINTTMLIKSSVMILLWQADDSYVPPFYKGKALPSPQSEIKVVAMPEIKSGSQTTNPTNLVYTWKQDYTNVPDGSGYGKNSFTYVNDYLDGSNNIDVVASTVDQTSSSEASIDVGTYQPKIVFYKNDLQLGTLWEQAISDEHKVTGDETIQAAPYFISPGDIRIPTLIWSWSINDSPVVIQSFQQNLMPLKLQPGVSGTSKIDLQISNTYKLFENVSKEINVNF